MTFHSMDYNPDRRSHTRAPLSPHISRHLVSINPFIYSFLIFTILTFPRCRHLLICIHSHSLQCDPVLLFPPMWQFQPRTYSLSYHQGRISSGSHVPTPTYTWSILSFLSLLFCGVVTLIRLLDFRCPGDGRVLRRVMFIIFLEGLPCPIMVSFPHNSPQPHRLLGLATRLRMLLFSSHATLVSACTVGYCETSHPGR